MRRIVKQDKVMPMPIQVRWGICVLFFVLILPVNTLLLESTPISESKFISKVSKLDGMSGMLDDDGGCAQQSYQARFHGVTESMFLQGGILWVNSDPVDEILTVAVGDLNSDGRDDALVGSRSPPVGSIKGGYAYALDGTTGEQLWRIRAHTTDASSVAVCDLNGDGQDEAIVGDGDFVYAQKGADGMRLWCSDRCSYVISLAFYDLNEDGWNDVLVGTSASIFALNGKDGSILPGWSKKSIKFVHVVVGNWIYAGSRNGIVYAYNHNGAQIWKHTGSHGETYAFAGGDFNDDGIGDVLVGSFEDGVVYTLDGAHGNLLWEYKEPIGRINSVAVGDFNDDEVDDAVAGSVEGNIYAIDGTAGKTLWINKEQWGVEIKEVDVGDFNGDGVDDVLTKADYRRVYMINGKDGATLRYYEYDFYDVIVKFGDELAVGDFDNNGVDDALVGSGHKVYAMSLIVVDSDGDGLADESEVLIYDTDPQDVDTDGDGYDDLVEIIVYETDPSNKDTDGDGLVEIFERSHGTNPTNADTDDDGLSDGDRCTSIIPIRQSRIRTWILMVMASPMWRRSIFITRIPMSRTPMTTDWRMVRRSTLMEQIQRMRILMLMESKMVKRFKMERIP